MKVRLEFASDGERLVVLEALGRVFRLPEGDLAGIETFVVTQLLATLRIQFLRGDQKMSTDEVLSSDRNHRNEIVERRASLAKAKVIFGE